MNQLNTQTTLPLSALSHWEGNVRKHDVKGDLSALADSIQAHGLLQPLVIIQEEGRGFVVAGQRRLLALQLLQKEGTINENYPVSVTITTKENALEASLAENIIREDMHPADQFQAFDELRKSGLNSTEIANRYGKSVSEVEKLLALGRVAPAIMDAFRADEIDLSGVMAFTLTHDQEQQLDVWERLKDLPEWQRNAGRIKAIIVNDEVRASDPRVKVIGGIEAYEAAGGGVRRDLFDDRNAGYLTDPELLEKLVAEKLEETRQALLAEGWSNVRILEDFGWSERSKMVEETGKKPPLTEQQKEALKDLMAERDQLDQIGETNDGLTDEEEDRYNDLTAAIEAIEDRPKKYSLATLGRSNAYIVVEHHGIQIYRGWTFKKDMPKKKGKDAEQSAEAEQPDVKTAFSQTLIGNLQIEATGALQAELIHNYDLALKLAVYASLRDYASGVDISFRERGLNGGKAKTEIEEHFAKITEGMPETEHVQDAKALWNWINGLDVYRLQKLFTYSVARASEDRFLGFVREQAGVNLRDWFTPAADNYFGKVSKDQIFTDLTEMGVSKSTIEGLAKMKKGDLAKKAEEYAAQSNDWIPQPMRLER